MKSRLVAAIVGSLIVTSTAWADELKNVDAQMVSFKKRIDNGKRDKSLTGEEAARLDAEYDALTRMIAEAKRDGKITHEEKRMIDERQDALGRMIFKQKHDAEGRPAQAKK